MTNPLTPEENREANAGRTYDWLHPDMPICGPQFSDEEVASQVRMLMRNQLNHEAICTMARDRIMCLAKEKADQAEELAKTKARLAEYEGAVEVGPNLGATDNEPGLRDILIRHYRECFARPTAERLADNYLTAIGLRQLQEK